MKLIEERQASIYPVDTLSTSIYDFEYQLHELVELDHEREFDEEDLQRKKNIISLSIFRTTSHLTKNHIVNLLPWIMIIISI